MFKLNLAKSSRARATSTGNDRSELPIAVNAIDWSMSLDLFLPYAIRRVDINTKTY